MHSICDLLTAANTYHSIKISFFYFLFLISYVMNVYCFHLPHFTHSTKNTLPILYFNWFWNWELKSKSYKSIIINYVQMQTILVFVFSFIWTLIMVLFVVALQWNRTADIWLFGNAAIQIFWFDKSALINIGLNFLIYDFYTMGDINHLLC